MTGQTMDRLKCSSSAERRCVSSQIADKYLLCLHNYFIMSFPSLEKEKNTQSLQCLLSLSLILSVLHRLLQTDAAT